MTIANLAAQAKEASILLADVKTDVKNNALAEIAKALKANSSEIIKANLSDLEDAEKNNLAAPLLKRLKFDQAKIDEVCQGIESLIKLDDPVGQILNATELAVGLELYKVSCPIGVIGVIFESRPDALVQISTLCLKSGNAVILKGGSEAEKTNSILKKIIAQTTEKNAIPTGWIQLLHTRQDVSAMLELDSSIDLIIPRGSNAFVKYIMDNTNIAVLGHADGICHVYVDDSADIEMAVNITTDSKCQYVSVCNAVETLLVHKDIAQAFLPKLKESLDKFNVELHGCKKTAKIIDVKPADENEWKTEYLDYKLSVKIVDNIDQAIEHINTFGSGHTDVIITSNTKNAEEFMNLVDSGDVFFNCSTRFSDGFRFGFGAEVGISTNKIHARGPVGLDGLVIYKYKLIGNGHTVTDFSNGKYKYTHKKIEKDFNLGK
ncbi:MAG TPA: glutamate-5-semialdehyde dehydrogenase [Sedimentisphaerales bacterium]|nr:glutamate-5-semialdehyde dehydrogenase [Sedimentisphaerales bacterium]